MRVGANSSARGKQEESRILVVDLKVFESEVDGSMRKRYLAVCGSCLDQLMYICIFV